MKIGLVRHFEVIQPYLVRRQMNSAEFAAWLESYDTADIRVKDCDMGGVEWETCYSSDLPRAVQTARTLFSGEITITPLLREIYLSPFFETRLRLPFHLWDTGGRMAWYFSHRSQRETRDLTLGRIRDFLHLATENGAQNVLAVSHGGLMWFMRRELLRMGFRGGNFTRAENGRLYLFERSG